MMMTREKTSSAEREYDGDTDDNVPMHACRKNSQISRVPQPILRSGSRT
jgi:hypothetical protein